MQIVIRLEQKDFEGNKEVFDRMYGLCSVLNKKTGPVEMTKAEVEKSANVWEERNRRRTIRRQRITPPKWNTQ